MTITRDFIEGAFIKELENLRMIADSLEDNGWSIRWVWDIGCTYTAFEAELGDRIVGIQVANVVRRVNTDDDFAVRWSAYAVNGGLTAYSKRFLAPVDAIREVI